MPIKVEKKDGALEEFDRNKISGGVIKSGATPEEAAKIAGEVETWVQSVAVEGVIKTSQIRDKVLDLLRVANPTAAATFETFKKPQ